MIVRAAYAAGVTANVLGLAGPTPGELASVLPGVDMRVGRAMTGHRFVNAALTRLSARRGHAALMPLVDWRGAEHLASSRGPAVLVAWHAGVVGIIGAALRVIERPAAIFRTHAPEPSLHARTIVIGRGVAARAAALQQGVESLREGRVVVMVVEAHPGRRARHAFLGRHAHLPAGPGALVRLGRARLVPITSRVMGDRVHVEAHPPLALGADPTADYATWFSAHYRAHPDELWPEALVHALHARPHQATPEP